MKPLCRKRHLYTFCKNIRQANLTKAYSLTLGKESCSGAKTKYQFTLILHLVLIKLDNDFGGVDYDNTKQ